MKKLTVILFLATSFTTFGFVDTKQKAVDVFNSTFKNVEDVEWFSTKDGFSVSFKKNGITNCIYYNAKGAFMGSRRYYTEDYLPIQILYKVKEKYPGKEIVHVTEVFENSMLLYGIRLEDEKDAILVEVKDDGSLNQVLKFARQEKWNGNG